jgi:hypothetical protein
MAHEAEVEGVEVDEQAVSWVLEGTLGVWAL